MRSYKDNYTLLILFIPLENKLLASDVYFIDYSKVMNESTAGKKAQNYLKNLLKIQKKFNETAKIKRRGK